MSESQEIKTVAELIGAIKEVGRVYVWCNAFVEDGLYFPVAKSKALAAIREEYSFGLPCRAVVREDANGDMAVFIN